MNLASFFDYPDSDSNPSHYDMTFLAQWGNNEWRNLLDHSQTYRFSAGDFAIRHGDIERAFYLVAFGQFEILSSSPNDSANRLLSIVETGSILGEQTFLDNQPHSTDIRAITDGELVRVSYTAFETFSAHEPELARDVLLELGRIVSLRLRGIVDS